MASNFNDFKMSLYLKGREVKHLRLDFVKTRYAWGLGVRGD